MPHIIPLKTCHIDISELLSDNPADGEKYTSWRVLVKADPVRLGLLPAAHVPTHVPTDDDDCSCWVYLGDQDQKDWTTDVSKALRHVGVSQQIVDLMIEAYNQGYTHAKLDGVE